MLRAPCSYKTASVCWGWGINWLLAFTQLLCLHCTLLHHITLTVSLPSLSPLSSLPPCPLSTPPPGQRGGVGRESRKEERLLRGASAAKVSSQELKCHPGARCAFLTLKERSSLYSESLCSFVVNTKRQASVLVTITICRSTKSHFFVTLYTWCCFTPRKKTSKDL